MLSKRVIKYFENNKFIELYEESPYSAGYNPRPRNFGNKRDFSN